MLTVSENLQRIMRAVKGADVRQSIHDAIKQCYNDATGNPESIVEYAKKVDELHQTFEMIKSNTLPTEGFYAKGDIVWCTGDTNILCWKRLTSGDSHVLGVDWIALYGLTEAP